MKAVLLAPLAGLMMGAASLAPAAAVPVITAAPEAVAPLLTPVRHHRHHGYWHHRHERWSRYAPSDAQPPETNAAETPAPAYTPAPVYPPAPAAAYGPEAGSTEQPPAAARPRSTPGHTARAPGSASPSIEWVNPDRPAR
jgi:hypothetical protein